MSHGFLCDDKDFHALVVGVKIAQMGGITMTETRAPEQFAVVVDGSRTDHHLVETVTVHITNSQAMCALSIDALPFFVGGVFPQYFQFGTIPTVCRSIAIGVDATHSDSTWCWSAVDIEESYTALEPVATMPICGTIGLSRAVVPVAAYAEQWPVVNSGQFVTCHTIEARQPFFASAGDDPR